MPKVTLSQVELDKTASRESLASGSKTPAPTRKDTGSTGEATPASLPQDGWGQGLSPVHRELFPNGEQEVPLDTSVKATQEIREDKAEPPGNDGLEGQQREETPAVEVPQDAVETQVVPELPEPPAAQGEPQETDALEPTPPVEKQDHVPELLEPPKVTPPKPNVDVKAKAKAQPQPKAALYQNGNYWRTVCFT